jgi:hypothetical protein
MVIFKFQAFSDNTKSVHILIKMFQILMVNNTYLMRL